MLDVGADRADLELRLIKLLLKDRAPVHPLPATAAHCADWNSGDVRSHGPAADQDRLSHFR
jgi:hypothetical protein